MSMRRGDSSMPSVVMSSKGVLPDKARVSPWRVAPTVAGVVARAESLRGRMGCLRVCWRRALGISPIPSFPKCRKARNLGTA